MNLVIDIGNSLTKIAVFQKDVLLEKIISDKESFERNLEFILNSFPKMENGLLSSVANRRFPLLEELKKDKQILELSTGCKLPFENLYQSPETLGNDRKGLVAAAAKQFKHKNTLIIDAGTCITFDFKNKENQYLGGSISPGLTMRFQALHAFTSNLPLIEHTEIPKLVGGSTQSSLQSGVILGMAKEIDGIIAAYQTKYQDLTVIFTGGDAHFLSRSLKNGIFANSNFLLEGLNYILEFNIIQ